MAKRRGTGIRPAESAGGSHSYLSFPEVLIFIRQIMKLLIDGKESWVIRMSRFCPWCAPDGHAFR